MSEDKHRLGVSEINLVVRHLKLVVDNGDSIDRALSEIDQIYGMDGVSFDPASGVFNAAYDASRVNLGEIDRVLGDHGIEISHDWWTHLKAGYYQFVDQNVKDNARHEPWSCHKPPVQSKR